MIPMSDYAENVRKIIHIAESYAKESMSAAIMPAHLLKALLHKDIGLAGFIEKIDKDYYSILDWANNYIAESPRSSGVFKKPDLSEGTEEVIREGQNLQARFGCADLDPYLLLAAVVTQGVGFSAEQLKSLPLTPEEVFTGLQLQPSVKYEGYNAPSFNITGKNLEKYAINKNKGIESGLIQPVVGFEKEIATIYAVLGRKNKSNLLITGEPGVGKTSFVNSFVQHIVAGDVPSFLAHSVVYEIDLMALLSDANYKGEIEDRFKNIIHEIKQFGNAILLIESVDKIIDKQGPLYDISNILKQELNRGDIFLICTSSTDNYTKHLEPDKEFVNKFEKITIQEPDFEQCFRILKGSINFYEKYHGLTLSDNVIKDAIRLSKRYMTEKALPDSAFDLLDRTMSLIKTTNDISEKDIDSIHAKLIELRASVKGQEPESLMMKLNWIHYELYNRVSCLLTGQLEHDDVDFRKIEKADSRIEHLESIIRKLTVLAKKKRLFVENTDLFSVISKQTGIPVGKLQSKERDKLLNAEVELNKRVVGQDHAIRIIVNALKISGANLHEKGKPIGSFFLLGPTGTGKTELAKTLAEFLFEDETNMIRFDMSEFSESHSAALLLGAPPWYVGYEEGGLLVNKIRQRPYSVVLFDEIEKAHSDVYNVFLQIIGEGRVHDKLGRIGDFSNALVLFTSNVASDYIFESYEKLKIPESDALMKIMSQYFRQEFLGRFKDFGGAIIPFSPITEETNLKIFNINCNKFLATLAEQGISFVVHETARKSLALSGFSKQFGARPILGIIYNKIKQPIAELLLLKKITSGSEIELQYVDNEYKWIF
jgi:ATP-dependent Clp protease ATP-binding subunit ClpB